jgi:DNA ligase 4
MMQPTPAPTSPPSSPKSPEKELEAEDAHTYPAPPNNRGSAPFHVLVALFVKLQNEKKPDRRRRMLVAWFNVGTIERFDLTCLN